MKNYLRDAVKKSKQPSITIMSGILIPEMITKRNNDHQKIPMQPLDENWVSLFSAFISYFRAEMEIINDIELNKIWKQLMTIYDLEKDNRPISIEKPREIIYPELNNKSGHRVFISYCNTQKDDVEKIKAVLEKNKISVEYEPGYLVNIPTFMKKVRTTKFVLLLISKEYLENEVCMSAILELKKDDNFKNRMLLIVHDNANINTTGTITYIEYWRKQHENLSALSNPLSLEAAGALGDDIKKFRNIYNEIAGFIADVKNIFTVPLEDLRKSNYEQIIQYILTH